jgi:hypothetical protein
VNESVAPTVMVTEQQKLQYGGVFLLQNMVQEGQQYPLLLEGADRDLEPLLDWLFARRYTEIEDESHYVPTPKGRQVLERFLARYENFLRTIDIYCAVDLEEGTFAFERLFDFEDERDWHEFLAQERFSDLRVAVAEFKQIDPIELVFMASIGDGTLSTEDDGWQTHLTQGEFWSMLEEVVRSALRAEDLGHVDDEGHVDGQEVLRRVIVEGAELNLELKKHEAELEAAERAATPEHAADTVVEETTVTEYEPYVDPYYVSPVWLGLWLL